MSEIWHGDINCEIVVILIMLLKEYFGILTPTIIKANTLSDE
jgi:hypothetical protein